MHSSKSIIKAYSFDERAVGSFVELIRELRAADTKRERARLLTMVAGFVRSLQYLKAGERVTGQLIGVNEHYDALTNQYHYSFVFTHKEEASDVKPSAV